MSKGIIINHVDTIKESVYSSLSFSLTGAVKVKNCTNTSSINCISEINEDNQDDDLNVSTQPVNYQVCLSFA